jgi:hypothetical protein
MESIRVMDSVWVQCLCSGQYQGNRQYKGHGWRKGHGQCQDHGNRVTGYSVKIMVRVTVI